MLAATLGRFASGLRYEDLPVEVVEAVKLRILDTFAAHLAGLKENRLEPLLQLLDGMGDVAVWGSDATRSMRDAAMINSAVSHAVYFEDGSRFTGGHPSSAVIPGVLTFAAAKHLPGTAVIAAIAAGYEVFLRLGRVLYPSTVKRGFQSTAILAAPSTAAATAVLLGLDASQAANAIAIACGHAAGLKEALKSADTQPLQVGRAVEGGMLAALYAAQGGGGAPQAFERGFLTGYADGADPATVSAAVIDGLGENWRIFETYLKVHGGCRGNHAPTDVMMALMREHRLRPADYAQARIFVDSVTSAANIDDPADGNQAQFSIRFSAAVAAVKGDALPGRFSDAMLRDEQVSSLMRRMTVAIDPALDAGYPEHRAARIELMLSDGRALTGTIDNARGEPEYPLSAEDVEGKFRLMAQDALTAETETVIAQVRKLDRLKDASELVAMLQGSR